MVLAFLSHLLVILAVLSPACFAAPVPGGLQAPPSLRRRLSKDKEIEATPSPTYAATIVATTNSPTEAPTIVPTAQPTRTTAQPVKTPVPTALNVAYVPAPTGQPAVSSPDSVPPPTPPTTNGPIPTFDNNVTATRVTLKDFAVSIRTNVDESFNRDDVIAIYKREVRQSLQQYFHKNLGFENILLVQLHELSSSRRELQMEIDETFQYGGRVDFRGKAPMAPVLQDRQEALLTSPDALQGYFNTENPYLQAINVTNIQLRADTGQSTPSSSSSSDDGNMRFIVIIAVASGVALAVLLLLCMSLYRLCRPPPPPPMPSTVAGGSKGAMSKSLAPYDDPRLDQSVTTTSSAEHLQLALSESTAAMTVITEPGRSDGPHVVIPDIVRKDSEDSMDGYSLGSGFYGQPKQPNPSWMRPSKRASPVPEYNSDNESQFTYEQIAEKTEASALGPALSIDIDSEDDEELARPGSTVINAGLIPPDSLNETMDSLSSSLGPSHYAKSVEDDDGSNPFDEALEDSMGIDDSMEQHYDAFSQELNRIQRTSRESDASTRLVSNVAERR